jgi:hypothetical protein
MYDSVAWSDGIEYEDELEFEDDGGNDCELGETREEDQIFSSLWLRTSA